MTRSNKNVLVVDDSALIITRITDLLEEVKGISAIRSSMSYDEAVELLKTFKPDVALLDINLPGKSGIDLLEYIKKNFPAMLTIMVTNQATDFHRDQCFKTGADYFIDKSKDFDKIPQILSEL